MSNIDTPQSQPVADDLPLCCLLNIPTNITDLSVFKTYSYLFSIRQFCDDVLSILTNVDDFELQLYCFYENLKEIYTEMYGEVPKPDLEKSMLDLSRMLTHIVIELDDVYQLNDKVLPYDVLWIQDTNVIGLINGHAVPTNIVNSILYPHKHSS